MKPNPQNSRGYFGIGAECISKSVNLGGLLRSGASAMLEAMVASAPPSQPPTGLGRVRDGS